MKAIVLAGAKMAKNSKSKAVDQLYAKAVYELAACIKASLAAATGKALIPSRLMFEFTENETVADPAHIENIVTSSSA